MTKKTPKEKVALWKELGLDHDYSKPFFVGDDKYLGLPYCNEANVMRVFQIHPEFRGKIRLEKSGHEYTWVRGDKRDVHMTYGNCTELLVFLQVMGLYELTEETIWKCLPLIVKVDMENQIKELEDENERKK